MGLAPLSQVSGHSKVEEAFLEPIPARASLGAQQHAPILPWWRSEPSAEYDIYLGQYGTFTPRVQFYFQDETRFRPQNKTFETTGANTPCPAENPLNGCRNGFLLAGDQGNDLQEQYHYTDVKLTWRSPSERWLVEGFVQNLEDAVVYQNVLVGTPILDSPQMAWYGHPRIWGMRVGFRY